MPKTPSFARYYRVSLTIGRVVNSFSVRADNKDHAMNLAMTDIASYGFTLGDGNSLSISVSPDTCGREDSQEILPEAVVSL
jgi:hypothetical protein